MTCAIAFTAPDDIDQAIRRIGRTEDLAFSPDNRRLAIAGFGASLVVILDIEVDHRSGSRVDISGYLELGSASICEPHGVSFLDDDLIVVANRAGVAPVFRLPPPVPGIRRLSIAPLDVHAAAQDRDVETPGSVTAHPIAADLFELLVCNNFVNRVTRHVLDVRTNQMLAGEVLVSAGLDIPDGVAVSNDRRWLAVSSHNTSDVQMFELGPRLDATTPATGRLYNINFPHGLRFTPDDRYVLVADAGAPYLHVFCRGSDDWRGGRDPIATVRVMDDESYLRGRHNPQEGGPKGLDIDRTGRLVALTSDQMPLAFFSIASFTGEQPVAPEAPTLMASPSMDEAARTVLVRELEHRALLAGQVDHLERAATANDEQLSAHQAALTERDATIAEHLATIRGLHDEIAAQVDLVEMGRAREASFEAAVLERDGALTECAERLAATNAGREADEATWASRLDYLGRVVDDRDRQLDAIRRSRAWRFLRPLRGVAPRRRRR